MQHLDFIVWMLGFPIAIELSELVGSYAKQKPAKDAGEAGPVLLLIWFGIGYLLW
jgi:hypothetical protein